VECLGSETVALYVAGGLSPGLRVRADAHVDRCPACRTWIARAARMATREGTSTAPASDTPVIPARGTAIGRYIVEAVVGRGAMGVVLRAHDPALVRPVALKLLHRGTNSETEHAAVLGEARNLARLSDPHVVQVFDVETWCGRLVLAMELVVGTSLRRAVEGASRHQILRMLLAAARGLAAAHAAGIVHRDFKPDNVLVADDPRGHRVDRRVLVGDFGLAQLADVDRTQDTVAGAPDDIIVGTPAYMAPEQRTGSNVDARADQYAFCVTAIELLLGARPSANDDPSRLAAQLHALPRPLARALARGLAHAPQSRAPTMDGLITALERAGTPSLARASVIASASWLVPVAALGGLIAAIAWIRPQLAPEIVAADALDEPSRISPEVQLLMERSVVHDRSNDPHGMLAVLDEAVATAEASEDRAGLAQAWAARGSQRGKLGQAALAIDDLERAFHLATRIERADIAADAALIRMGLLAEDLARPDEAMTWGRHAEATLARMEVLEIRVQADFDAAMGRTHRMRGENEQARERFERAARALRAESPRLDRHLFGVLSLLGRTELALGELELGRRHLQQSVDVALVVLGPDHPDLGAAFANLAGVDAAQGDTASALQHLERARPLVANAYGEQHPNVLTIDFSRASLWMRSGRVQETVAMLERVLERAPAELPITCGLQERLALALARLDRRDDARARYRTAIDCSTAIFGANSPESADARDGLAATERAAVRAP
jgi:serine/threonine protein kinase